MAKEKKQSLQNLADSYHTKKQNSYDLERSNYGDPDVRRASTIEVTSGQSFLLLQNQEFIIQLKSIKEHLSNKNHPIMQIITHFQMIFIEQNHLMLYNYSPGLNCDFREAELMISFD